MYMTACSPPKPAAAMHDFLTSFHALSIRANHNAGAIALSRSRFQGHIDPTVVGVGKVSTLHSSTRGQQLEPGDHGTYARAEGQGPRAGAQQPLRGRSVRRVLRTPPADCREEGACHSFIQRASSGGTPMSISLLLSVELLLVAAGDAPGRDQRHQARPPQAEGDAAATGAAAVDRNNP
ncbi:hypothetical protein ON010_g6528 [Phytophthora cinnamomi]|nr:hypothetical protein ON010_g6528 [Phytophthora cinnamomi]